MSFANTSGYNNYLFFQFKCVWLAILNKIKLRKTIILFYYILQLYVIKYNYIKVPILIIWLNFQSLLLINLKHQPFKFPVTNLEIIKDNNYIQLICLLYKYNTNIKKS